MDCVLKTVHSLREGNTLFPHDMGVVARGTIGACKG